jgi:NTP pyrophosphatase (non-canonical NTP hydrolase)
MARDVALQKSTWRCCSENYRRVAMALAYETEICQKVTEAIMKNDLLLL